MFNVILNRSFGRRKITLASGRESHFYLDMKPTMLHPEAAALIPDLILETLKDVRFEAVGGLELGAVPLISPLSMIAYIKHGREIPGFIVRQKVKDHGTKKLIESACELKGKDIVILDDVTTTGGSAMHAVDAVRAAGGNVVMVLAIVDREEGAVELYKENGIPFCSLFTASEILNATA